MAWPKAQQNKKHETKCSRNCLSRMPKQWQLQCDLDGIGLNPQCRVDVKPSVSRSHFLFCSSPDLVVDFFSQVIDATSTSHPCCQGLAAALAASSTSRQGSPPKRNDPIGFWKMKPVFVCTWKGPQREPC